MSLNFLLVESSELFFFPNAEDWPQLGKCSTTKLDPQPESLEI